MDIFEYFCNNNCLFKCRPNQFNGTIKKTLEQLLLCDHLITKHGHHIYNINIVKCIICLQICNLTIDHRNVKFVICAECCSKCTNMHVSIIICRFTGCWNTQDKLIITLYRHTRYNVNYYNIARTLINNSHALVHRYYHYVPIMFMLSILDHNSSCFVLNYDVVMYTLKLIY